MMAKDVVRRMKKYNRKMLPDRVAQQFELGKSDMIEQSVNTLGDIAGMEETTRVILGVYGIQTIQYPAYLNFARRIWKLKRNFSGATLEIEADNVRSIWVARQLDGEVLDKLLTDVFNLKKPEAA
jgi:hypothetical protein